VRFTDLLAIALSALYQQKVRTLLTTTGVVIGTLILIVSLSIGRGVEEVVLNEFSRYDQLRQIHVHSNNVAKEANVPPEELVVKGAMSAAKRERIRKAMIRWWSRKNIQHPVVPLTPDRLQALEQIEHVESVIPFIYQPCRAVFREKGLDVTACAANADNRHLRTRIVAGDFFHSDRDRCVVVHEYLLYLWGFTGDDDVQRAIGQTLHLEFHVGRRPPLLLLTLLNGGKENLTLEENRILDKAIKQLPGALDKLNLTQAEMDTLQRVLKNPSRRPRPVQEVSFVADFTIAGVLREFTEDDPRSSWALGQISRTADVFFPVQTAAELFSRTPLYLENGFDSVTVTVDREENVRGVVQQIRDLGLREFSLVEIYEQVHTNLILMTFATSFVAVVALLVAALGITNTMVMGVLERTREIGVMKAVGARDRHIQLIFLVEGALIGATGGVLGLLLGWIVSFPGDGVARSLVEKQIHNHVDQSLFAFPLWLTVGVPLLATAIATLAAVYPARRAARVNPIEALRHE
jgi:putative ABC transport system permease protein